MDIKPLIAHLKERPAQLALLKEKGTKIVGYFPGNYVPEEIVYAAGAVPLCLNSGGNYGPANAALSVVPRQICPFARSQIGEKLSGENPYYTMMDMLISPTRCHHLKKVTEIWEYYDSNLKIFKLGLPYEYARDFELAYYTTRLRRLKDTLQALTGNEITSRKLGSAIALYNRIRRLLREISLMRQTSPPGISTIDFIRLNHASMYADPVFMADFLESVHQELKVKKATTDSGAPRLLLIGPSLGNEDYQILELANEAGGEIVIEEIDEGIRYYWHDIENKDDLFESLARGYLLDRLPCAYMVNSTLKRFDFTLSLIKKFNVSGVIWYELLCCETYDTEAYYFARKLEDLNIPMLTLESDYSSSDAGRFKIRLEALVETIKGV